MLLLRHVVSRLKNPRIIVSKDLEGTVDLSSSITYCGLLALTARSSYIYCQPCAASTRVAPPIVFSIAYRLLSQTFIAYCFRILLLVLLTFIGNPVLPPHTNTIYHLFLLASNIYCLPYWSLTLRMSELPESYSQLQQSFLWLTHYGHKHADPNTHTHKHKHKHTHPPD